MTPMTDREPEPRTFTKKVGGETLTRQVTSATAEVSALFDGFTEKPAKASAARPAATGTGG
jgi:hypothetical protein